MKMRHILLLSITIILVFVTGCTEDRTVEPNTAMPPTYLRCAGTSCSNIIAPNGVFTDLNQVTDCDIKTVNVVNPPNQNEGAMISWVACEGQAFHYENLISKTGKRFWIRVDGVNL